MANQELNFWEHLGELRRYIIRSVIIFLLFFILAFSFKDFIFDKFLLRLLEDDFITYRMFNKLISFFGIASKNQVHAGFELINIKLSGQFIAHISISALVAAIISIPFLFFQLWLFIKPALYQNEKKIISQNALLIFFLFLLGCVFAYYIITPLSVLFLGNYQVSTSVKNTISLNSFVSVFNNTLFMTGLLFELPILLLVLARIGIINAKWLRKYRKHAIVVGLTLSAIITPTTDPFTMCIVAIPIYFLYEISIVSVTKKENKWLKR